MSSRRSLGPILALLLGTGCGGGSAHAPEPDQYNAPPHAGPDDTERVAAMTESLDDLDDALVRELAEVTPVSPETPPPAERCEEACNLSFNICDLSERVCTIADRNPDNSLLFEQCIDARVRCKRGARDTRAVCDCSAVELRIRI